MAGCSGLSRPRPFTADSLLASLQQLDVTTGYCVALSGGADSVALLIAMAELRHRLRKPLRALHVHHGLQQEADDWAAFCRDLCDRLKIPLQVIEIDIERERRESLEMAARRQRYAALAQSLRADEVLLTAHHLDDQAETFLLHLLRGAGVDGLAAMPTVRVFSRGLLCRPLLAWGREQLVAYLRERAIDWIEDPSNDDISFDRNYIRQTIMPMIASRWPAAAKTISRAAGLQAEQRQLNESLASNALASCYTFNTGSLQLDSLQSLDAMKKRLVLRSWLKLGQPKLTLSQAQLAALDARLASSRTFSYQLAGVQLLSFSGALYKRQTDANNPVLACFWQLDCRLHVAALGVVIEPSQILRHFPGLGPGDTLRITNRRGGETIYDPGVGHRPLKKMLQYWRVPPWRRARLPLIWCAEQLICVPGYWVASELDRD